MGFGKPEGFAPAGSITAPSDALDVRTSFHRRLLPGITLDDIRLEWETATTPHDLVTENVGTYEAGTICAYWWQLFGVVGDRRVVTIEYIASITDDAFMPRTGRDSPRACRARSPSSSRAVRRTVRCSCRTRSPTSGRTPAS